MSRRALLIIPVLTLLAACSKQEPPAVVTAAPAAKPASHVGAELAPPSSKAAPATPGGATSAPTIAPAPAPDPAALAAQLKQGEEIFQGTCATCHMADGNGVPNMQPGIVGSAWISAQDPQLLLSLILRGAAVMGDAANAYGNRMPSLDHLSDAEIASVATYVRQHFAATPINQPVTPAEVAIARARPGLPQ